MQIKTLTFSEWENALPATGFTWAHASETLRVLADHVTGELRLYGGFKGRQPIGLLPVVIRKESFATAVISPPPGFGIPQMGPILMPTSPKKRKQMKMNQEFTEAVLDTVAAHDTLTLFGMACSAEYTDPRPYIWAGLDVETLFTYQLDLDATTPDSVLQSFSRSLRREIRSAENSELTVTLRGIEGARNIHAAHRARRAEQGDEYSVSWKYTRDLVATLGNHARAYVAETPDGEFISGITVLYSNDEGYFLQGGTRADHQNRGVNALLHWRIIEDILTDPALSSIDRYDLGNANIESFAPYKSKYSAELTPYYLIKSGRLVDIAQKAYEIVKY